MMVTDKWDETAGSGPGNKAALLSQIEKGFAKLWAVVSSLGEEILSDTKVSPEWSAKDVITHITAWERVVVRFHLGKESFARVSGIPGAMYRETEEEILNEHFQRQAADIPAAEAKAALLTTHQRLVEALKVLPAELFFEKLKHPEIEPEIAEPLLNYIIANTYEHYAEHIVSLQALVKGDDQPR